MDNLAQPPAGATRNALEIWLAGASETDPALRQDLLYSTAPTLGRLFGRKLPDDIKVNAVEETATDLYVVRRFEAATEAPEPAAPQAQLLRTSIHALALGEDGFWDKLSADPKGVLAGRLAVTLPPQVRVHVLQEDVNTAYLVLHMAAHLQNWQPPAHLLPQVAAKP